MACVCTYVYIYIYMCVDVCVYIYMQMCESLDSFSHGFPDPECHTRLESISGYCSPFALHTNQQICIARY